MVGTLIVLYQLSYQSRYGLSAVGLIFRAEARGMYKLKVQFTLVKVALVGESSTQVSGIAVT